MASPDPLVPAARAIALTRAAMVIERLLRALWLSLSLALIAVTAWAFDLQTRLPGDVACLDTAQIVERPVEIAHARQPPGRMGMPDEVEAKRRGR